MFQHTEQFVLTCRTVCFAMANTLFPYGEHSVPLWRTLCSIRYEHFVSPYQNTLFFYSWTKCSPLWTNGLAIFPIQQKIHECHPFLYPTSSFTRWQIKWEKKLCVGWRGNATLLFEPSPLHILFKIAWYFWKSRFPSSSNHRLLAQLK